MHKTPSNFERFIWAQERDYTQALAELSAGKKRTHWIWYVFPQLYELGRSDTARLFGILGAEEALAYYSHPILGPRLVTCVQAILRHAGRGAEDILGTIDALKFQSCLTLFAHVAPNEPAFQTGLTVFFKGERDSETIRLLVQPTRHDTE